MVPVLEMHKRANSAPTHWDLHLRCSASPKARLRELYRYEVGEDDIPIMIKVWTKKITVFPVFLVVALLTIVGGALAQTNNVTVTGVIKDPAGGLIPGAHVTAHNTATGETKT